MIEGGGRGDRTGLEGEVEVGWHEKRESKARGVWVGGKRRWEVKYRLME